MIAGCVNRLGAFVMALALLLGPVAHASMVADMRASMASASASEMTIPEVCDGCVSNSQDTSAMVCSVPCAFPGAILPTAPLLQPVVVSQPTGSVKSTAVDRHPLPDPYPPKPI